MVIAQRNCLKHGNIGLHSGPGLRRWPDLPMSLFTGVLSACHGMHGVPDDHVTARQGGRGRHARQRKSRLQNSYCSLDGHRAPTIKLNREHRNMCGRNSYLAWKQV